MGNLGMNYDFESEYENIALSEIELAMMESKAKAKALKTWDNYSFSAAGGERRYNEFVADLEKIGGQVDPTFHAEILKKGWAKVIAGGKNFAGPKAKTISGGIPAYALVYKRGNPSELIDISKMERNVRGGKTMSTESKEVSFLLAVQVAQHAGVLDAKKIIQLIDAMDVNVLTSYLTNIHGVEKPEAILTDIIADPDNMRSSAVLAVNFLKKIRLDGGYSLHRGSSLYNEIRKKGAKLAGLGEDRWNPADVMFIRNSATSKVHELLALDSIVEFNAAFNALVGVHDIVPVSLKQTDKAAMGSVAIRKYADIESAKPWTGSAEEARNLLEKIRALVGVDGLNVFITWNPKAMTKSTTSMKLTDILMDAEFVEQARLSDAWNRCYPPVVNWLHNINKKGGLKNSLAAIALNAMSSGPSSAQYHKAMDTGITLVDPSLVAVEIMGIELQINSVSCLVHYRVSKGGEPVGDYSAQIRSKGSSPQVIVYNSTRGGGSSIQLA